MGISKFHSFYLKKVKKINLYFLLLQFLIIKTLDPYPDPDSLEMLDPQLWFCFAVHKYCRYLGR